MSEKIDYDAYLKQLGEVDTNQIQVIKQYLEEQCKEDSALAALYRPEKIDDCYRFIYRAAEKMKRTENCACITESIVYKMARDYFLEILPNIIDVAPAQEAVKEVAKQVEADAASDNVKHDYCGFEVFGEENDEPEEAEEEQQEEPCDQDEVGGEEKVLQPVASDIPKYDEEGNGLLFDF